MWDTSAFKGVHTPKRSLTYLNLKMAIDDRINPSYHKYYVIVMLLYEIFSKMRNYYNVFVIKHQYEKPSAGETSL